MSLTCVAHDEQAIFLTLCPKRCAIVTLIWDVNTSNDLHENMYTTRASPLKYYCRKSTWLGQLRRDSSRIMTSRGGFARHVLHSPTWRRQSYVRAMINVMPMWWALYWYWFNLLMSLTYRLWRCACVRYCPVNITIIVVIIDRIRLVLYL